MKRINFLKTIAVIAVSIFTLSACSKEEEKIIGQWEVTKNMKQIEYRANDASQQVILNATYNDTTIINDEVGLIYEFNKGGTGTITNPNNSANPTTFKYYFEDSNDDDFKIIIDVISDWDIDDMTKNGMSISANDEYQYQSVNGVPLPYTEERTLHIKFKRVSK